MKNIERFLCHGAGYTVLILSLYFLAAAIASPQDARLSAGKFFIILLFGFITAGAELLYKLLTVRTWLKALLHYAILLCAFLLIFIPLLSIPNNGPASVAAWTVIFTVIYALCVIAIHFIRRATGKVDIALEQRQAAKTKEEEYTPLYKDKGE